MRDAWEAYKLTDEYANTRRWALHEQHVDGSLWAAFVVGWTTFQRLTSPIDPPSQKDSPLVGPSGGPYVREDGHE
jgi:hypothetical protein